MQKIHKKWSAKGGGCQMPFSYDLHITMPTSYTIVVGVTEPVTTSDRATCVAR